MVLVSGRADCTTTQVERSLGKKLKLGRGQHIATTGPPGWTLVTPAKVDRTKRPIRADQTRITESAGILINYKY